GSSVSSTEDAIAAVVDELAEAHGGELVGVGIGAAGWFDRTGDTVLFSPHLAWRNSSLRKDLTARLRRPLWVGNDANAAAWAEYRYGAARDAYLALMITLGTGIGGGIVLDGRLRPGAHGVAGEWGHMRVVPDGRLCPCGNRGCWEQYASGTALVRDTRSQARQGSLIARSLVDRAGGDVQRITGPLITAAARDGDAFAREQLASLGKWLGEGIASLTAVLDPGVVVVGGGVSEAGDLLLDPVREHFKANLTGRNYRPELEVRAALLGNRAGMMGAADLARRP
ncbi:MAG TPA: ROK family protein, partial [Nocardioidaceae bacterium]|nr:ROK family protein [Nocardioidaceae bacterium]